MLLTKLNLILPKALTIEQLKLRVVKINQDKVDFSSSDSNFCEGFYAGTFRTIPYYRLFKISTKKEEYYIRKEYQPDVYLYVGEYLTDVESRVANILNSRVKRITGLGMHTP